MSSLKKLTLLSTVTGLVSSNDWDSAGIGLMSSRGDAEKASSTAGKIAMAGKANGVVELAIKSLATA